MGDEDFKKFTELMEELDRCGPGQAYRLILGLARTRRHLESLYQLLGPKQRISREDFIVLREHWQKRMWGGTAPGGKELPSDAAFQLLEEVFLEGGNLEPYYASLLDEGRQTIDTRIYALPLAERVVSGSRPRGGLAVHYFGRRFLLDCVFNGQSLKVELKIDTDRLDEEFAHRIRSCPAFMDARQNKSGRVHWDGGHEINFIIILPDSSELKGLTAPLEGRMYAATRDFCQALSSILESIGFPPSLICRLMPPDQRTATAERFTDRSGKIWAELY